MHPNQGKASNMRQSRLITTLILLACATQSGASAHDDASSGLPLEVKQFANKIQAMDKKQITDLIHKTWGNANSDIGSGLHIPAWHLKDGDLLMHPLQGPCFRSQGKITPLLELKIKVRDCLPGRYQVMYCQDKANQMWLGDIELKPVGTYLYHASGQKQAEFFAATYPNGRFESNYLVSADLALKSSSAPAQIAQIILFGPDKKSSKYAIKSNPAQRQFVWVGQDLKNIKITSDWRPPFKP